MVIIRRPKRRLKQYTRFTHEFKSQQQIKGRRLLTNRKYLHLPFNHANENKRIIHDDRYDLQQKKLKIMLIEELNSFFHNQNKNSQTNQKLIFPKQISSFQSNKQNFQDYLFSKNSLHHNFNLLTLLGNHLFYSISFSFGYFIIQYLRQSRIRSFSAIFTRSLLSHICLTYFSQSDKSNRRILLIPMNIKTSLKKFITIRQDILFRLITSCLHLIAELIIDFNCDDLV